MHRWCGVLRATAVASTPFASGATRAVVAKVGSAVVVELWEMRFYSVVPTIERCGISQQ